MAEVSEVLHRGIAEYSATVPSFPNPSLFQPSESAKLSGRESNCLQVGGGHKPQRGNFTGRG